MAKNNFVAQMSAIKHKAYMEGYEAGKEIQRMAMCIALNETFGFAGERLERLAPVLEEIWSEMKTVEPELFTEHIIARARQIKGVTVGKKV
jgi:hypothetical protein